MKNKLKFFVTGISFIVIGILIGYGLTFQSDNNPVLKAEPTAKNYQSQKQLDLLSFNEAFISVAERANPSVVTVFTETVIKRPAQEFRSPFSDRDPFRDFFGEDFFDRFFRIPIPEGELRQRGLGSGVIVREDGYIITNNHVVFINNEKADVIKVKLLGDKEYDAKIVGTDPKTDIAVLRIKEENLPVLPLGDSDKLRVGEWVLAIGSPFGEALAQTVTAGIVSAKGRSNVGLAEYSDFIQTDAAINPGNSGGALINLKGELVGINTAIISGTQGFQGVGLAVPINMAKNVMDQLISKGKVVRGWLGVWIQPITEDTKRVLDLKDQKGALISQVAENSPAEKADLRIQDVVKALDGKEVINTDDLRNRIAATSPGTWVTLNIIRDGKERDIRVRLAELPPDEQIVSPVTEKTEETIGITVSEITPGIASKFQFDSNEKGVVITNVNPSGVGASADLRVGDIIKKVNKTNIESVKDYDGAVKSLKKGDSVLMHVKRPDGSFFISFRIPE